MLVSRYFLYFEQQSESAMKKTAIYRQQKDENLFEMNLPLTPFRL